VAAARVLLATSAALALSGCIPPSPEFPSENTPIRDEAGRDPTPLLVTDMAILSGEQPVWQAEPVRPTAATTGGTYVVQPGDTLSAIAEREGVGLSTLAEANQLQAPYPIRIGQRLALPQGRFHRVEAGDTGIGIARAYGVKWSDVIAANSLTEPYVLKIGQRLRMPAAIRAELPENLEMPAQETSSFTLDLEDILTGSEPADVPQEASIGLPPLTGPQVPVRAPVALTSSFAWPAPGQLVGRFGPAGEGRFNSGLEIATAPAAPIRASADGVVAYVGNNVAGFGGMILIRHGADWITTYGRAASTSVRRGQQVKQGDVIGNTGSGSRPQLHFGLRKGKAAVDPLTKLPPL
jgi:lipoprotein NlpD